MLVTKIYKTYENLKQFVLIEDVKRCDHNDLKTCVDKQKAAILDDVAQLADDFSLPYKVSFEARQISSQSFSFKSHGQSSIGKKPLSASGLIIGKLTVIYD